MLKAVARHVLNKTINRSRFNDSLLYKLYVEIAMPAQAKAKRIEKDFYRRVLGRQNVDLVFDVGASGGSKTFIFLDLAKRVLSVEANPTAVASLRQRFSHNTRVQIIAKGCGAWNGTAQLHIFGETDGYNTFSTKWVDELAR